MNINQSWFPSGADHTDRENQSAGMVLVAPGVGMQVVKE